MRPGIRPLPCIPRHARERPARKVNISPAGREAEAPRAAPWAGQVPARTEEQREMASSTGALHIFPREVEMRAHGMMLVPVLLGLGALADEQAGPGQRSEQVIQESFVGTIAQTQEPRVFQTTLGVDARPRDPEAALTTELRLRYGLSDALQVESDLELGWVTPEGVQLGTLEPGATYALFDSRELGLSIISGVDASLPLGGLSRGEPYALVPRAGLYKLLLPVVVSLEVGAEVPVAGGSGSRAPSPRGALTVFWAQEGLLHPLVEASTEGGEETMTRFAAGTVLVLGEQWQVGLAYVLTRREGLTLSGGFGTLTWVLGG